MIGKVVVKSYPNDVWSLLEKWQKHGKECESRAYSFHYSLGRKCLVVALTWLAPVPGSPNIRQRQDYGRDIPIDDLNDLDNLIHAAVENVLEEFAPNEDPN